MKTWHKIIKYFKGGSDTYQIAVPHGVRLSKDDWDTIMEWIGENTNGGHSEGYRIMRSRLRKQSEKFKVLSYPADLCEATMAHGKVVTSTRTWI